MKLYLIEIDDPADGYTEGPRWRTVSVCSSETKAQEIVDKIKSTRQSIHTNIEPIESDSHPMVI